MAFLRRILPLVLLALLLPRGVVRADNAVDNTQNVQKIACNAVTPSASHQATCQYTTQNTKAGNADIVEVLVDSGTITVSSVSDGSGSGTCVQIKARNTASAPADDVEEWGCPNLTGGAKDIITVTLSSGTPVTSINLREVHGLGTTLTIDKTASQNNAASTGGTALTGTTSNTTANQADWCDAVIGSDTSGKMYALDPTVGGATTGVTAPAWNLGPTNNAASNSLGSASTTITYAVGMTMGWTWSGSVATNAVIGCLKGSVQPLIVPDGTPAQTNGLVFSVGAGSKTAPLASGISNGDCCFLSICIDTGSSACSITGVSGGGDSYSQVISFPWSNQGGATKNYPHQVWLTKHAAGNTAPTVTSGGTCAVYQMLSTCYRPPLGSTCPVSGTPAGIDSGYPVTTAVSASGTATVTTSVTNDYVTGQTVCVSGSTGTRPDPLCGIITVSSGTVFTMPSLSTGTQTGGGSWPIETLAPQDTAGATGNLAAWFFCWEAPSSSMGSQQPENAEGQISSPSSSSVEAHTGSYLETNSGTLAQYSVTGISNVGGDGVTIQLSGATPTATPTPRHGGFLSFFGLHGRNQGL
jgi:hypothetical protein